MSNTVSVNAPNDINSASHAGQSYERGEDGFFHMPQEAAVALAPMGFTLVASDAPAATPTSETDESGASASPAPTPSDAPAGEGNENPEPAPAPATEGENPDAPAASAPEGTPSSSTEPAGDEFESLLGGEGQPDGYALEGGDILPAREVLKAAFQRTGATIAEWNALSAEERASLIKLVADELPLAKVVDPAIETLENEGGKPALQTPEGEEGGDGVSAAPAAA